jgi:hypothetical protein
LAPHLKRLAGGPLRLDDGTAFVDAVDHGLFAVHRLPGVQGVDGDLAMPVVGGGDDDGVHILPGQDLPVVPRGDDVDRYLFPFLALHTPPLPGPCDAPLVEITRGHEFDALDVQRRVDVDGPHAPSPDDGELDLVVGTAPPSGTSKGPVLGGRQRRGGAGRQNGSRSQLAEEGSS